MQKYVPWIVGAVVIVGWGFYNQGAEARKGYRDCIQQGMFSSDLHNRCTCLSREIADEIPFSYYLPVIGPIFFEPTALEAEALFRGNMNQCSR